MAKLYLGSMVHLNVVLIHSNRFQLLDQSTFQDFHKLMRFRVRDILLVSSMYDSYIFEEDGRRGQRLRGRRR